MKPKTYWLGILGIVLILIFSIAAATHISHTSDLKRVMISSITLDLLYVATGIFLITLYLKAKKTEEQQVETLTNTPNSLENVKNLRKTQNWIIGFLLILFIIRSISTAILDPFVGGFTYLNIEVVMDLVFSILLIFIVVELFRNKRNVSNILFYTIIVYSIIDFTIVYLRIGILYALLPILDGIYYSLAIKIPTNRHNFRIVNFIVLPLVMILSIALVLISQTKINAENKTEHLLEQEYSTSSEAINNAYNLYLQNPAASNVPYVRTLLAADTLKNKQLVDAVQEQEKLEEETPLTTSQLKLMERYQDYRALLAIYQQETDKLDELMAFSEKIDLAHETPEENAYANVLEQQATSYNEKITDAVNKLSND